MRSAGILLPITSLPSPWGVGAIGQTARDFVDFLERGGQTYWQILPICPTSYGDSPYQSFSSCAGNPYLIDLDGLCQEGLLLPNEYRDLSWGDDPERVDYGLLYRQRYPILRKAVGRLLEHHPAEFETFCTRWNDWLEDYALFMALKTRYGGASWADWPAPLRRRESAEVSAAKEELWGEIRFWQGVQYLFFRQWDALKSYANRHGVSIIGDLPIYVSTDSADVWANPEQFQLDENLTPVEVSGCPPDGFSADGQLWGNPLFNWDVMKQDGYQWWIRRISFQFRIYDALRIDHFRGFDSFYAIPAGAKTARNGRWRDGPGIGFFRCLERALGKRPIIAEDLGFLTSSVRNLLRETGFPGMKVLEFAFDSRDTGSGYLPHSYPRHCVVYTGTHDNDTVLGWMNTAPRADVERAKAYLRLTAEEGYNWGMMRSIWGSVGDLAIVQMQDLLGLGNEARMNTPSTIGNNWVWRCRPDAFSGALADRLYRESELYGRLPVPGEKTTTTK